MPDLLKDIDVFILCGGFGKRLGEITRKIPKPMVKIGDKFFLDLLLDYLSALGFRRFILGTGYKNNVIRKHYSKKQKIGRTIIFSNEKTPLDTGGAVKNAGKLINSGLFMVLNGDSFCEFDPLKFIKFHKEKNSLASVLLRKISNAGDYGQIKINKNCRIVKFTEKNEKARNCFINAGVYIFDKRMFYLMPQAEKFSLEKDFFPKILKDNFFGYPYCKSFIDIGTPERYMKAEKYFSGKFESLSNLR